MRIVIQRVKEASVSVENACVGRISKGLLIFVGVSKMDQESDVDFLVDKVSTLRIFEDDAGKMNLCAEQVNGQFLVVSQFTLYGDCRKGRRPSFDSAADPQKGEELYLYFIERLRAQGFEVQTGRFRAMMDVALINDGPVTLVIDSEGRNATI
ncbi:MAG: D-tyrosyl-tRNA(Tyr) deacylase [Candidatus Omnitrophica bacterium]|nr:D-tyrosyl-tRNA(Tyr) deacylase [Candidatus Omnitrophota bacterium]